MEESIYQVVEKISKLYQEAYDVYLSLVEDVCGRIKFYIEAYREMCEDENK